VQSGAALRLERWLCTHFADVVVAVSGAVSAQLEPTNVVICYDQVDPAEFHPGRAGSFRARTGLADDAPVVGAAGRIDTWKGLDVLLDATPEMQRRRPGLQVVIAGPDVAGKEPYAARLADRARSMSGVHWLGPRRDMAELIADLDALVMPSTEPEPFGLTAIEALASGVPVVATAAGGPLEILGPNPTAAGRLVPPAEPARLAEATVEMLPLTTSTGSRRDRPVLHPAAPAGDLGSVFEKALSGSGRRRPRGTRRRFLQRSASR